MRIRSDLILHALVCLVATLAAFAYMSVFFPFFPSLAGAWLLPMGLGIGKEYGDSKASGNHWDWLDIVADIAGILLGFGIIALGWWPR